MKLANFSAYIASWILFHVDDFEDFMTPFPRPDLLGPLDGWYVTTASLLDSPIPRFTGT